MNRDHGCSSSPGVASTTRSLGSTDFPTMEPELFDFGSLNSRCREDVAAHNGRSSPHLQRLPLPRRSFSDDMLPARSRPSRARGGGGPKRSRRFIPPFKMMSSRGGSTRGDAIGNSDHARASVSSDSRTTLSSKSRQSHVLHGDGTSLSGSRKVHGDAELPFDSFAMTLTVSDFEHDCISEVSVDDDADQKPTLLPAFGNRHLPSTASAPANSLSTRQLSHRTSAVASTPNQLAFAEDAAWPPSNRYHRVSADGGASNSQASITSSCCQEPALMVEVISGSFVPLIGTRDTLDAYQRGSVVDQACLGCNEFLLCSERATLVICPVCRSISPVVVTGGSSSGGQEASNLGGRGLLGLGLTVHLIESEILRLP